MKYLYHVTLNPSIISDCYNKFSREDIRIMDRKLNELLMSYASMRLFDSSYTTQNSGAEFEKAFKLGYIASMCQSVHDTELCKAMQEDEE